MGQTPADQETTATLLRSPAIHTRRTSRGEQLPFFPCSKFEGPNWRKWRTFLCITKERAGRRAGPPHHSTGSPAHWRRDCCMNSPIGRDTAESRMFQSQDRACFRKHYIQAATVGSVKAKIALRHA